MFKIRLVKFFLATSVFITLPFLFFSTSLAKEPRASKVVILSPPDGEKRNFYIVFGQTVEVQGEVNGDVYAAGGQVAIEGKVNGDVLVAGGTVVISGDVTQDVRVLGGDVFVKGKIGKNLTVLSGSLEVLSPSAIGGGLAAGTGSLTLAAPVEGQVKVASGKSLFADFIGSDVEVWSDEISVTRTSKVGGDFVYTSSKEAMIQEGASISGRLARNSLPQYDPGAKLKLRNFVDRIKIQIKVIAFLSSLLIGLILVRFFAPLVKQISELLEKNLVRSLVVGLFSIFLIPVLSILLLITLIGIPLALIVMASYLTTLYLSKIFVSFWIGAKIFGKMNKYLSFSLVLLMIFILSLIPVFGGFITFAIYFLGLGSVLTLFWERNFRFHQ